MLVFATGLLDLAVYYLRLSVLVSWIAPRDSRFRNWISPLPSIAVDPAMAVGASSGFNINVAPMLAIWSHGDRAVQGESHLPENAECSRAHKDSERPARPADVRRALETRDGDPSKRRSNEWNVRERASVKGANITPSSCPGSLDMPKGNAAA